MKIAFVLSSAPHYFFFDRVVRSLYAMGHEVRVVCRPGFKPDGNKSGRALLQLLKDEPRARFDEGIFRSKGANFAVTIRELANYANFLRPGHPNPPSSQPWAHIYIRNRLYARLEWVIESRLGNLILSFGVVRRLLAWIETQVQPDPEIMQWLEDFAPQVLFVSPFIMSSDLEIEYAKAAKKLGIPTVASVLSWDNLVSKGTYLVKPEWLFVWNQELLLEAVKIHEFEEERVFKTGAPVYDPWFEISSSLDRETFCAQCGLNPDHPYLLYLGSSPTITDLDVEVLRTLISHLEQADAGLRPSIIIRPHPYARFDMTVFERDWVKVFPQGGGRPDVDETRQVYFDSLFHSACVMGINTTGFLDAAIVDKPCITVMDSRISAGQNAHFQYLLRADFVELAANFYETLQLMEAIIGGADAKRENRRRFVREFIRPQGIDIPASEIMANAILAVGHGIRPDQWKETTHE